jgi:hypothetical protein
MSLAEMPGLIRIDKQGNGRGIPLAAECRRPTVLECLDECSEK